MKQTLLIKYKYGILIKTYMNIFNTNKSYLYLYVMKRIFKSHSLGGGTFQERRIFAFSPLFCLSRNLISRVGAPFKSVEFLLNYSSSLNSLDSSNNKHFHLLFSNFHSMQRL